MKKPLIYSALLATSVVALVSCDDSKSAPTQPSQPQQTAAVEAEQATEPETPASPTAEDAAMHFKQKFSSIPFIKLDNVDLEATPRGDGSHQLTAKLTLSVLENLYNKQQSPNEFKEGRKVVQSIHNDAVRPDSAYLLNMGAESSLLTEQDKQPKALPENLQQMYTELVNLSESYCYAKTRSQGDLITIEYNLDAVSKDGKWEFSNVVEKEDLISPLAYMTPQSALPEGAPILTQEFADARNAEIKTKADAFIAAVETYLISREEPLRQELVARQARQAEEARKAEEVAKAESERTAAQKQWNDFCTATFAQDCKFCGEWTRDGRFGELTLKIAKATVFEKSIHFYGKLYDTKLPKASISISGRCSMVREENGTSKVDVTLYDGAYDPDEPTAEVYDAADGRLILTMDDKGVLSGVMTCASWSETPERSFTVRLTAKAEDGKE